eukprot:TRINITY_DN13669_c0_g1_i1.p1 TRINITY_DN13669_c0_g1~~TRINITY_DN13669_c0_g1_i1.p1  ORF type:complete len:452 (+),score=97.76 TRINITY_DN13669_c0_g1_i1:64-1419(+)
MGRERNRYQRLEKIGEGSCGVVFRCRDKESGAIVAVKKVCFSYESSDHGCFGVPAAFLREVALTKALAPHPNVTALRDAFVEAERAYLVFEYIERDLRHHLDQAGPLHGQVTKLYAWQLLGALAHCHARRVAHRDLKPQNVLVKPEAHLVKLCDFSLGRRLVHPRAGAPQTRRVASLWYRSPEVLLGDEACGLALDIWSAGCVLAEMLLHRPLFAGGSEVETLFLHFRLIGTPTEATWPGISGLPHFNKKFPRFQAPPDGLLPVVLAQDRAGALLLRDLLRCWPAQRPFACAALSSPYFRDVDTTILKVGEGVSEGGRRKQQRSSRAAAEQTISRTEARPARRDEDDLPEVEDVTTAPTEKQPGNAKGKHSRADVADERRRSRSVRRPREEVANKGRRSRSAEGRRSRSRGGPRRRSLEEKQERKQEETREPPSRPGGNAAALLRKAFGLA